MLMFDSPCAVLPGKDSSGKGYSDGEFTECNTSSKLLLVPRFVILFSYKVMLGFTESFSTAGGLVIYISYHIQLLA